MPLLADLIDIPESVQRDDFVLKLTAGVAHEAAAKTLGSYVVTPELAEKFDEALGFVRAALETGTSKSAFLKRIGRPMALRQASAWRGGS